jgi:exopolyphosphatase/guanosine-5'-triphosphate,3'-diphosphate pyrophosphatase
MRVAAIDVGTNTVLCTIADLDAGRARVVSEHEHIPRLGAGVDRARRLAPEACARTLAVLGELSERIRSAGVKETLAVGTSALRDAEGGADFVREASRVLGTEVRVLSGADEARLTFAGSTWELELEGPVCVVDIGGGSTEIVEGDMTRGLERAVSLDLGSVRLFERCVQHDPPAPSELSQVRSTVRDSLSRLPAPRPAALVGVAGTVTTLVVLSGRAMSHGAPLARSEVDALAASLAAMSLAERLQLTQLARGRADVIPVGAALLGEIMAWLGVEGLAASDRGVRWGLLRERAALDLA